MAIAALRPTGDALESTMSNPAASAQEAPYTATGLAARLEAPFRSTEELLQLLVPPLAHLSLLDDHPDLVRSFARQSDAFDSARFLRRQVGFVQKALLERVWPDWEGPLEQEYGAAGLAVLERYFLSPPIPSTSTSDDGKRSEAAEEVVLSAYAVLSSLLAVRKADQLQPRTLQVVMQLLSQLSTRFSIDELAAATLERSNPGGAGSLNGQPKLLDDDEEGDAVDPISRTRWDESLRDMLAVPARAANAAGAAQAQRTTRLGSPLGDLPAELEESNYRCRLAESYTSLLWRLSSFPAQYPYSALAAPLSALIGDPTFVPTIAIDLVPRCLPLEAFPAPSDVLLRRQRYMDIWRGVIDELAQQKRDRFLRDWMRVLEQKASGADCPVTPTQVARGGAHSLESLFGPLASTNSPSQDALVRVILDFPSPAPRSVLPSTVAAWANTPNAKVAFLTAVMRAWGSSDDIKRGTDGRRLYLTALFLFTIVSLPIRHESVVALSRSPDFLEAVSVHLSLVAPLPRLLGMLVAEIVSARTVDPAGSVKPLAFGDEIWSGEGSEKQAIRDLRVQLEGFEAGTGSGSWQAAFRRLFSSTPPASGASRQQPTSRAPLQPTSVEEPPPPPKPKRPLISIIGEDDDDHDDLKPYDLPPAPNAAIQAALESEDPALYHSAFPSQAASTSGAAGAPSQTRKRGRIRPPVYIPELTSYLKGKDPQGSKEEADSEAERLEIGLKEGESLVRRKAGWGGELRENAVDLAFALMGLQNQFEIEDFDERKQGILIALAVACPREVVPAIIEQYFTDSYSIAQRHVLLATLAFSARELADLAVPPQHQRAQVPGADGPLFPSKQLPPAQHNRLIQQQASNAAGNQLDALASDLTRLALSGAKADAETSMPEAAREKLLAVNRTTRRSAGLSKTPAKQSDATFATLAAEVFILPLLNRFWLYLRDEATSTRSSAGSYLGGTSAPQLLEPILLSRFLATVSVLVHAARHSPAFLAVVVPETLSFLLTLRPAIQPPPSGSRHTASQGVGVPLDGDLVTAAALELALAALDGTVQLDGGRMLMSSSVADGSGGALVADIKDWAEEVFEAEEQRGGDLAVGRPGRAAAGVLLRVEEIVGKWRLSVGW